MTIQTVYSPDGGAFCRNDKGLAFYLPGQPLQAEPPRPTFPGDPRAHQAPGSPAPRGGYAWRK